MMSASEGIELNATRTSPCSVPVARNPPPTASVVAALPPARPPRPSGTWYACVSTEHGVARGGQHTWNSAFGHCTGERSRSSPAPRAPAAAHLAAAWRQRDDARAADSVERVSRGVKGYEIPQLPMLNGVVHICAPPARSGGLFTDLWRAVAASASGLLVEAAA